MRLAVTEIDTHCVDRTLILTLDVLQDIYYLYFIIINTKYLSSFCMTSTYSNGIHLSRNTSTT